MPKRRKDKDPVPVMPQRYTWKTKATFNTYEEALASLPFDEKSNIKIKRRKNSFDVRVGTLIKKD